jgi:hypothetical protein
VQEATTEKILNSVTGHKRKDQMRNTKIREQVNNIFNLNHKILKSGSQLEISQRMEDRRIPK